MQASLENTESFLLSRASGERARKEAAREQLRKTSAQVLRASRIARSGHRGYNNGETLTYNTRWVNIGYDGDADIATQAKLHGVYDTRLWVLPGKLACVHLYLRAADLDTETYPRSIDYGHHDYVALFGTHPHEIIVPRAQTLEGEKPFPLEGDTVIPDSQQWRELDYVLGQIEARPY